jgi:hypothetical protein
LGFKETMYRPQPQSQPQSYADVKQYCNYPDSGTRALGLDSYNTLVGKPVPWMEWYQRTPDYGVGALGGFPWCPYNNNNNQRR